jgi:hypothetical protein
VKNKMSLTKMTEREMKDVKGAYDIYINGDGTVCGCGCYYANKGGSSTYWNGTTNRDYGLYSPIQ